MKRLWQHALALFILTILILNGCVPPAAAQQPVATRLLHRGWWWLLTAAAQQPSPPLARSLRRAQHLPPSHRFWYRPGDHSNRGSLSR